MSDRVGYAMIAMIVGAAGVGWMVARLERDKVG